MTATLTGNTRYRAETAYRAAELNDNAFKLTREACAELAEKLQRAHGKPATPKEFAAALTQVLQTADLELADATTSRLRRLTPAARKRRITASPGDVVAIPAPGGYRLAVVITRNAFSTALGFLAGTAPTPRASTTIQLGLQLGDPALGLGEFSLLTAGQSRLQVTIDAVLTSPRVNRLIADPQVMSEFRRLAGQPRSSPEPCAGTPASIHVVPYHSPFKIEWHEIQQRASGQPGAHQSIVWPAATTGLSVFTHS